MIPSSTHLLKNARSSLAMVQYVPHEVLDVVLGEVGVVAEIGERHLRLDHPELREVTACVGVLGTEGRSEGVHPVKSECVGLGRQLATHRQERRSAEEVLSGVDALRTLPCPLGVEHRDSKHLTSSLGITGRDDRSVQVEEVSILEESMGGIRELIANSGDRTQRVCACSKVGDLAETLEGDSLLLQWVALRVGKPDRLDLRGLDLHPLALARRFCQDTSDPSRASDGESEHVLFVVGQGAVGDDLDAIERGAVVQLDE